MPAEPAAAAVAAAPPVSPLTPVIVEALRVATALARPDLAERLSSVSAALGSSDVRVVVLGEFKHGKSSLVNALVGADVCRVADDIATALPTVVRYGDKSAAVVVLGTPGHEQREPVAFEAAVAAGAGEREGVSRVELTVPSPRLRSGLILVDTAGTGGLPSGSALSALRSVSLADAVLFVSDGSQPYSASQVRLLTAAKQLCPVIVCAVSKSDIYHQLPRIVEENREILTGNGLPSVVFPISSWTWRRALAEKNEADQIISGMLPLLDTLIRQLPEVAAKRRTATAGSEVVGALQQLRAPLAAAQAALADSTDRAALEASLREAKERADSLKSQTSRWQVLLNDGIADVQSEADHDLRTRIRTMTQEAETAIDDSDPARMWDEFAGWLQERTGHELTELYMALTQQAEDVVQGVARLFAEDSNDIVQAHRGADHQILLGDVIEPQLPASALERNTVNSAVSLVRNTFASMSLAGSIGSMAGWVVSGTLNPVTLGIGLMLGGRTLTDERTKRMEQRRTQAKAAVRKYTDEVSFLVGKDVKDTIKGLQRDVRDSYTQRAEELTKSAAAAIAQTQTALQGHESERKATAAGLTKKLQVIDKLLQAAGAPGPAAARTGSTR